MVIYPRLPITSGVDYFAGLKPFSSIPLSFFQPGCLTAFFTTAFLTEVLTCSASGLSKVLPFPLYLFQSTFQQSRSSFATFFLYLPPMLASRSARPSPLGFSSSRIPTWVPSTAFHFPVPPVHALQFTTPPLRGCSTTDQ